VQDVTLNAYRGSLSYVTGAHSVKVGYQGQYTTSDQVFHSNSTLLAYRFQNRAANQVTWRLPEWETADRTIPNAFYAQDTWTRNRLSVQGALRYDQASSYSPAKGNGTQVTSRFNAAPIALERTQGVHTYRDISPRVGAAYDVFGNGKTAVKFNPATGPGDQRYDLHRQQPERANRVTASRNGRTPTRTSSWIATSSTRRPRPGGTRGADRRCPQLRQARPDAVNPAC
jgi:hypothetical protein